jgi:hypothetical protein
MLWGGFNPSVRNAIDVNQLPPTEAISKHLQPIVYSSANLPEGFLAESIGPVTLTQTFLGAGLSMGAALIPVVKSYLGSAALQTVNGGLAVPVPPPAAPSEKPVLEEAPPAPLAAPTPP